MKLRRKIDGLLAEGRGSQLLWLILILAASFLVFCGISKFIFQDGTFSWQDILALYLDPGVFGGAGKHDWFRLLITLFGAFFFAAMLISVISNIFENISESYTKGETRYHFENHILFLGANFMLIGMLQKLYEEWKRDKLNGRHIVIMTTRQVEELRDVIESCFIDEAWLRNLTFYYDRRDIKEKLEKADAAKASCIYVLGEDNEVDHDNKNICCLEGLRCICHESDSHCYILMENQVTMRSFQYSSSESNSRFKVDIVNIYEHLAYEVLCNYPNSSADALSIDYRVENGKRKSGILTHTKQYVHIVIIGLSEMGHAMAKISACLCHFSNYSIEKRTKITIIEPDISKIEDFMGFYPNLFSASKVTRTLQNNFNQPSYQPWNANSSIEEDSDIDVEWEFIVDRPSSLFVRKMLTDWAKNSEKESLSVILCDDDCKKNVSTLLTLPFNFISAGDTNKSRENGIPVFVYLANQQELIKDIQKNVLNLEGFGYTDNWISPVVCNINRGKDKQDFFSLCPFRYLFDDNPVFDKWDTYSEKDRHRFLYKFIVISTLKKNKVNDICKENILKRSSKVVTLLLETNNRE